MTIPTLKELCLKQIELEKKINLFLIYEEPHMVKSKTFRISKYNDVDIQINDEIEKFRQYIIWIKLDKEILYIFINDNYKILLNGIHDDICPGYIFENSIYFKHPIILSKFDIFDISKNISKNYLEYNSSPSLMLKYEMNEWEYIYDGLNNLDGFTQKLKLII